MSNQNGRKLKKAQKLQPLQVLTSSIIYGQAIVEQHRVIYLKSCCKIKTKLLPYLKYNLYSRSEFVCFNTNIEETSWIFREGYGEAVVVTFFRNKSHCWEFFDAPWKWFQFTKVLFRFSLLLSLHTLSAWHFSKRFLGLTDRQRVGTDAFIKPSFGHEE